MQLPGRLAATTLGDLLGALHRERASGVLELVERSGASAGRAHRIVLDAGLVRDVETALGVPRVGEILRREGFIDGGAARLLARRLVAAPTLRAGEVLVGECGVSSGALGAALRFQLRARLDRLFELADGQIRFHVTGVPRPRERAVPLSPHEFLHGRPRARGASRRAPAPSPATPSKRHDPVRARALTVLGLGPAADRASVQRAFRALAREAHPDRFPAASAEERETLRRRFAELSAAYHALVA
ncbi:MAG: J domain-containing protein [Polyangiaceae bacterium]|nr:J domain-containing protein [Polyangiaceae bacterium]